MRHVKPLYGQDDLVGFWIRKGYGANWIPGEGYAIGYTNVEGRLVAGFCYTKFTGTTVWMDARCEKDSNWFSPETMFEIWHYPFVQLNCKDLRCYVARSNVESINLIEKQDMELEAVLKDADITGDLLIYKLSKEKIMKWLEPQKTSEGMN